MQYSYQRDPESQHYKQTILAQATVQKNSSKKILGIILTVILGGLGIFMSTKVFAAGGDPRHPSAHLQQTVNVHNDDKLEFNFRISSSNPFKKQDSLREGMYYRILAWNTRQNQGESEKIRALRQHDFCFDRTKSLNYTRITAASTEDINFSNKMSYSKPSGYYDTVSGNISIDRDDLYDSITYVFSNGRVSYDENYKGEAQPFDNPEIEMVLCYKMNIVHSMNNQRRYSVAQGNRAIDLSADTRVSRDSDEKMIQMLKAVTKKVDLVQGEPSYSHSLITKILQSNDIDLDKTIVLNDLRISPIPVSTHDTVIIAHNARCNPSLNHYLDSNSDVRVHYLNQLHTPIVIASQEIISTTTNNNNLRYIPVSKRFAIVYKGTAGIKNMGGMETRCIDNNSLLKIPISNGPDYTKPSISYAITKNRLTFKVTDSQSGYKTGSLRWGYFSWGAADSSPMCTENFAGDFASSSMTLMITKELHNQLVCVKASDNAGNTTYLSVALKYETPWNSKPDYRGPTISHNVLENTLTFKVTDEQSGYKIGSLRWGVLNSNQRCAAGLTDILNSATKTIIITKSLHNQVVCVKASDNAGNTSYAAIRLIRTTDDSNSVGVTDIRRSIQRNTAVDQTPVKILKAIHKWSNDYKWGLPKNSNVAKVVLDYSKVDTQGKTISVKNGQFASDVDYNDIQIINNARCNSNALSQYRHSSDTPVYYSPGDYSNHLVTRAGSSSFAVVYIGDFSVNGAAMGASELRCIDNTHLNIIE